jgi:hypothetical protein
MKVFVVIPKPNRAPVALEVSKDDTLASVKARLHDMEGIPPWRQRLAFPYSALPDDDGTTLADHGVTDSSTFQLVETMMDVFVRCYHRRGNITLTISGAESTDTVESFRLRVLEQDHQAAIGRLPPAQQGDCVGLRPARQRLRFNGRRMEDGGTLADYGVQNDSTIRLEFRWIIDWRTRVVELDIKATDTAGRIKERVEQVKGVPVACQSVSHHGTELDDDRTLADYDHVVIHCQRQMSNGATNTSSKEKGEEPVIMEETAKRRADIDESGIGKKNKKSKKIKKKPSADQTAEIPAMRRFTVYLCGPELAEICSSSCDTDPAP